MAHRIENKLREQNPELVTGLDMKKVNEALGTITHQAGQRGYTVKLMSVPLPMSFSTKEIRTLAYKLVSNHRLRISDIRVESGWRDDNDARACHAQSI